MDNHLSALSGLPASFQQMNNDYQNMQGISGVSMEGQEFANQDTTTNQQAPDQAPQPNNVSPPSASNLRLPFPVDKFEDRMNPRTWVDRLKLAFMGIPNIAETQKVVVAVGHLGEDAFNWYQEEALAVGTAMPFSDFESFSKALVEQFTLVTDTEMAELEIESLFQTGTVDDYERRFRQLARRIPDMSPAEKKRRFLAGLRQNTKLEMIRQQHDSFDALVRAAKLYDQTRYSLPRSTQPPRQPRPAPQPARYMQQPFAANYGHQQHRYAPQFSRPAAPQGRPAPRNFEPMEIDHLSAPRQPQRRQDPYLRAQLFAQQL
ncbi:hypothetical protein GGI12_005588, partial [Dipsacomyces acuminosporus]